MRELILFFLLFIYWVKDSMGKILIGQEQIRSHILTQLNSTKPLSKHLKSARVITLSIFLLST